MPVFVPLDRVLDNPYQPRQRYAGIDELARSILRDGLEQVPKARLTLANGERHDPSGFGPTTAWVEGAIEVGGRLELVYGHRRQRAVARAWDIVAESGGALGAAGTKLEGWPERSMPVELAPVSDEDMLRKAVAENRQREDLSAVEEAESMLRAKGGFGYTDEQLGELYGYSRSAVSNKLRLLRLPDDVRQLNVTGELSEAKCRALVAAFDSRAEHPDLWNDTAVGMLVNRAQITDSAAQLRDIVEAVVADVDKRAEAVRREREPGMFADEPEAEQPKGERVILVRDVPVRINASSVDGVDAHMVEAGYFPPSASGYIHLLGSSITDPDERIAGWLGNQAITTDKHRTSLLQKHRKDVASVTDRKVKSDPVGCVITLGILNEHVPNYALTARDEAEAQAWVQLGLDAVARLADWPTNYDAFEHHVWTPAKVEERRAEGLAMRGALEAAAGGHYAPLAALASPSIAEAYEVADEDRRAARGAVEAAKSAVEVPDTDGYDDGGRHLAAVAEAQGMQPFTDEPFAEPAGDAAGQGAGPVETGHVGNPEARGDLGHTDEDEAQWEAEWGALQDRLETVMRTVPEEPRGVLTRLLGLAVAPPPPEGSPTHALVFGRELGALVTAQMEVAFGQGEARDAAASWGVEVEWPAPPEGSREAFVDEVSAHVEAARGARAQAGRVKADDRKKLVAYAEEHERIVNEKPEAYVATATPADVRAVADALGLAVPADLETEEPAACTNQRERKLWRAVRDRGAEGQVPRASDEKAAHWLVSQGALVSVDGALYLPEHVPDVSADTPDEEAPPHPGTGGPIPTAAVGDEESAGARAKGLGPLTDDECAILGGMLAGYDATQADGYPTAGRPEAARERLVERGFVQRWQSRYGSVSPDRLLFTRDGTRAAVDLKVSGNRPAFDVAHAVATPASDAPVPAGEGFDFSKPAQRAEVEA